MIILKKLSWSNAFSYGKDNVIEFDKHSIVQLIGKNGHGKSSIALILEEILFNKNSKGIKKSDILNRYSPEKSYSIELTFSKNNNEYVVKTVRGSTQSVKLICNGEDISEHTSTATYKLLEEIWGFDHKTFTQIVYQSSSASLEFLTATDTNRKKFLIDLLNLSIYTRGSELFKGVLKTANNEAEVSSLKINTLNDWLIKFGKEDLTEKNLVEVPNTADAEMSELVEITNQLRNIEASNKKITQNNTYKGILNNIDITVVSKPEEELKTLEDKSNALLAKLTQLDSIIRGTGVLKDKCSSCGQPIDISHKKKIKEDAENSKLTTTNEFNVVNTELHRVSKLYATYDKYVKNLAEWERYYTLIDSSLPTKTYDRATLEGRSNDLNKIINDTNSSINSAIRKNSEIAAHNAKIAVIEGQMKSVSAELAKHTSELSVLQKKITTLQLLNKTFSTSGLVAYKIECLVKDLEKLTNEYLLDMSDGRFQISFKVSSSDKLNVIITDNGRDIDILALSNGERARVNISTLLAIRKLMQSLSNSRINLLILDETVESLDSGGKEHLIETLLKEESLNTILVSHSYSNPLINKIFINKINNISTIEV